MARSSALEEGHRYLVVVASSNQTPRIKVWKGEAASASVRVRCCLPPKTPDWEIFTRAPASARPCCPEYDPHAVGPRRERVETRAPVGPELRSMLKDGPAFVVVALGEHHGPLGASPDPNVEGMSGLEHQAHVGPDATLC